MTEAFDGVVLQPSSPHQASVIWLHGLGADGHDFEPLADMLALPQRGCRTILPHAPRRPVTVNGGYVMRAWYDVRYPDLSVAPDEQGIRGSAELIRRLFEDEVAGGIPASRIILAGFSQGGVVALYTGLRLAQRAAGLIALSSYLPLTETLQAETRTHTPPLPVFVGHGQLDPVVPLEDGRAAAERLAELGCRVDFHTYPAPHSLHADEVEDLGRWFSAILG